MNTLLEQSLEQNQLMTQSLTNTMATGLIGRSVRVETGDLILEDSGDVMIRFDLPQAAANVTLEISDAEGSLVRVLRLDARPSGTTEVAWDGLDVSGNRLPAGQYKVEIDATDADGAVIESRPYFRGTVDGVHYASGVALLTIGDALVPMGNVIEVSADEE
jgi:flagellar basal-body rod modification protein FlgD